MTTWRSCSTRCADVLEPEGSSSLTAHTPGFDARSARQLLATGCGARPADVETGDLDLRPRDGRRLELGAFARSPGAAS